MEALLVSFGTVTVAEMGDRTQLLSLMLVARYGRPLNSTTLDIAVGTSMIVSGA